MAKIKLKDFIEANKEGILAVQAMVDLEKKKKANNEKIDYGATLAYAIKTKKDAEIDYT